MSSTSLTRSQDASTSAAVGDGTVGVDAELRRRQSSTDAVLSITKLANGAGHTARSGEAEAAGVASAHKSVRSSREGGNSDDVFHNWEDRQRMTLIRTESERKSMKP